MYGTESDGTRFLKIRNSLLRISPLDRCKVKICHKLHSPQDFYVVKVGSGP
jgi:hypothetical protein